MRFALTALALVLAGSTADAQFRYQQSCPNGQCPTVPGVQYGAAPQYSLGANVYADPGPAPSANHELHLQGNRLVWVAKVGAPVATAPPVPAPKFTANPESPGDRHGRMFYRVVKDRAYGQLVERGVPKDKARKLVDTLSNESIDVYAQHVQIAGQIGDGKILDWLIDHRAEIIALIKLIVSLLAVL